MKNYIKLKKDQFVMLKEDRPMAGLTTHMVGRVVEENVHENMRLIQFFHDKKHRYWFSEQVLKQANVWPEV